ncbi:MAG: hypothetical protein HYW57_00245 [Ignavibacteriales bacterium]|nr:hypothetical protein [Ignavibacteriales bacterium]
MDKTFSLITQNQKDFLNFLRTKYALFHLSNVFFRDLHYGVMAYLDLKQIRYRYSEAEDLTRRLVESWQTQEILRKIDARAYMLNYPDFKKPPVKPAAPAKPAAKPASAPSQSSAAAGPSGASTAVGSAQKPETTVEEAVKATPAPEAEAGQN